MVDNIKPQSNQYGYARMPRIIRKGYTSLTKLQKLLYIYLRDLCGESGICYRSLRTLAKETDFSIGYLSINIPELAKAGLIKAEKAKHNNHKWEVWHVTIIDIWEENARFIQAEKCSQDEQIDPSESKECLSGEHLDSESVQDMNTLPEKCSYGANKEEKSLIENPLLNKKKDDTSIDITPEMEIFQKNWIACKYRNPKGSLAITAKNIEWYHKIAPYGQTMEELDHYCLFAISLLPAVNDGLVHIANLHNCHVAWSTKKDEQSQQASEGQGDDYIPGPIPADTYRSATRICLKYHIRLKTSEYVTKELDRIYNQVQSKSRFERLMGEAGEKAETIEVFLKQLEDAVPMGVEV